ncbi:MAG: hypothetical protein JNJ59_04010 [Deltaproteobacteria bacterium]|nr:hypothetical protein [Deltaproteobacteria bacterium]
MTSRPELSGADSAGCARAAVRGLVAMGLVGVGGCATLDPAVPFRLPDNDWSVGLVGGVAWDERESLLDGGPLAGVEVGWLDDVFGVHGGLRVQGEGRTARVTATAEVTAWYLLLFGLGVRTGFAPPESERDLSSAAPESARGREVPRWATDLTLLVALPIPLWKDCVGRTGALVLAPYARPGIRITGGDPDPDDLRGFHEIGVMLRWSSFAF